jgi:hypothetical protein
VASQQRSQHHALVDAVHRFGDVHDGSARRGGAARTELRDERLQYGPAHIASPDPHSGDLQTGSTIQGDTIAHVGQLTRGRHTLPCLASPRLHSGDLQTSSSIRGKTIAHVGQLARGRHTLPCPAVRQSLRGECAGRVQPAPMGKPGLNEMLAGSISKGNLVQRFT